MRRQQISVAEARRISMAAQGLDRERPAGAIDARHYRRVIGRLGLLQLDFVNVLVPAHHLVLWSRLGAFDRARFERFIYARGAYIEQWAHEASIVPAHCWPWFEHRRRAHRMHNYNPLRKLKGQRTYLDAVLEQVRRDGAVTAGDLPSLPAPKRKPGDWYRSLPRRALEFHFARGELAVARRLPNFQRVYDLPERVLPREHLERSMSRADAEREALRHAAGAIGVGTLQDLADYYRMSPRECAPRVAELVEEGTLAEIRVEGWKGTAYLAPSARLPRSIRGASLLSPFDPLLWFRPRAERLFDFHYRIEIYVPAHKRKWGYYVLPFRIGDRIVARVDLKADRAARRLLVRAAHEETQGLDEDGVERLAAELQALAGWLELDDVDVTRHNEFSRRLSAIL
jgi:uncharacterized protein